VTWSEWTRDFEVEPSLYAADFARLGEQVDELLAAGVRVFHFDVGDGHFIPPITMGPIVLESIASRVHEAGAVLDCHLMVESPERHFGQFRESGADSVSVHFETCPALAPVVGLARQEGLQVGLVFNPETEVEPVASAAIAAEVDLVLCMSVHPGWSGQAFIPESVERVRRLRELLPESMPIQVDGGVGPANIRELFEAGARLFVAGGALFGNADPARAYRQLVDALA
jgi:ribulose-phosphate 3-epimerase